MVKVDLGWNLLGPVPMVMVEEQWDYHYLPVDVVIVVLIQSMQGGLIVLPGNINAIIVILKVILDKCAAKIHYIINMPKLCKQYKKFQVNDPDQNTD